jgi:class 3 adenylate cyclase
VQPARPVDQGDRGFIDQRDAIPQDIPLRCAKEQCALADRELGLRAGPDEPRLVLAESVVVRNPEPLQRCPRLALGRDVLALVFADGALSRWAYSGDTVCRRH